MNNAKSLNKRLSLAELVRFRLSLIRVSDILWYIVVTLLMLGVSLLIPYLISILTGRVPESGSTGLLWGVTVFILAASLSAELFSTLRLFINDRLFAVPHLSAEAAAMQRVMSLPLDVIGHYGTGELKERMSAMTRLGDIAVQAIFMGVASVISAVAYICQIGAFAGALVPPALIILLLTLALSVWTTLRQTDINKKLIALEAQRSGMELSLLSGVTKLKQSGAEGRAFARWHRAYKKAAGYRYFPPMLLRVSPALIAAVRLFGTMAMYYVAAANGVSASGYIAFSAAYGGLSAAFGAIGDIVRSLADIASIYDMARPIMEAECQDEGSGEELRALRGDIELSHISFRYGEDAPFVLRDMSLSIHSGECIGITGPTGCGKTTLVRLLLGLIEPESGTVTVDGRELSELSIDSYRRHIGIVMQDGRLFASDIYANVTIAHPSLSEEEVWDALRVAHLDRDIEAAPLGLHSQIYENNGGISGGQRQRLLIAQAIAHRPSLLILDEATAALDTELEGQIMGDIARLGCTTIVIAHRPSALAHCDRVIRLPDVSD